MFKPMVVEGKFVWVKVPEQEIVDRRMFAEAVRTMPEKQVAEPVTFAGESNGKRNTEKQASVYDAMMAEIYAEHDGSKAKVRNRRSERRNHMAESWEAEKDRRKDAHWDYLVKKSRRDAGSKYGNHWASNAERKICKAEQIAREDWEIEERNHADAMAEYRDYIAMAEDHEHRLDRLEEIEGSVDFWEMSADYISREKIYEQNRIKQMIQYSDEIYAGEEYYRKQKSFGIDAGVYLRMIQREYREWLEWA